MSGSSFDRLCLTHLLHNEEFLRKTLPYISPDYFGDPGDREVFLQIKAFVGKYNTQPTKEALAIIFDDMNMAEAQFESVLNTLEALEPDSSDQRWLLDQAEKWAQDRAIYNALSQCIAIADGQDKKLHKNAIPGILSAALAVNFDSSIGHDYFEDAEAQYDYMHNDETKFRFDLEIMNRVTKGGVPRKTLNVVQAGINVGKTTWLIHQGAHALSQGKNVVYFTAEVAENVIRERTDARLMDITFDQLHQLDKSQYLGNVKSIRSKTEGRLIIKEFPSGSCHVGHFRHVLNELRMKQGFIPDMIIIDYLTICASAQLSGKDRGNSNTYYTAVAEEFRALAKEFDCILWTAAQFNRSGQNGDRDVGMDDIAQAIGIAATADFMVAFMQPEELASQDKIVGKVLKNRYANKAKIGKFLLGCNNDKQCFYDVDASQQNAVMDPDELAQFQNQKTPTPATEQGVQGWSFS